MWTCACESVTMAAALFPPGNSGGGALGSPLRIPRFQQVGTNFQDQREGIEAAIRQACQDGTLCVTVTTAVDPSVKDPDPDVEPACRIVKVPSGTVARGSTITFVVAAPCQG